MQAGAFMRSIFVVVVALVWVAKVFALSQLLKLNGRGLLGMEKFIITLEMHRIPWNPFWIHNNIKYDAAADDGVSGLGV